MGAADAESLAAEIEASALKGIDERQLQIQEQLAADLQSVFASLEGFVSGRSGPR